jgi:hypothetical protein
MKLYLSIKSVIINAFIVKASPSNLNIILLEFLDYIISSNHKLKKNLNLKNNKSNFNLYLIYNHSHKKHKANLLVLDLFYIPHQILGIIKNQQLPNGIQLVLYSVSTTSSHSLWCTSQINFLIILMAKIKGLIKPVATHYKD